MWKSTWVLVAVLALLNALVVPVAQAAELAPGGTFIDDDANAHEPDIEALAAAGITKGCAPERYCPGDPVSRGQMASFITRSVDGLIPATKDWFPDDTGSVHEADINVIAENGITIGYTDGTFRPHASISRAEMASMLVRALGLTPIIPPPRTTEVAAYFLLDSLGDDPIGPGPFLVPVARDILTPAAPATPTVQWLLDGPREAERLGMPSISTAVPEGTRLLGLTVANGVATVDFSAEFASGGGSFSMLARVAQVVYTLTQFPTVDEVSFAIEGVAVDVLGGEGLMLDSYGTRDGFLGVGLLPSVFVDTPTWGGESANPMRITGRTATFEGEFTVAIVDANGLILTEQNVLAGGLQVMGPGGPLWTGFDVTVPYAVDKTQVGALIVWARSAMDGSQIAVREYPVTLSP